MRSNRPVPLLTPALAAIMPDRAGLEQPWTWTYASLTDALRDRRILLRVHTSSSSPLPGPHNDPATAGFTSRNVAFRNLDPERYSLAVSGLRGDKDWTEGLYMRHVIIDHVNNRTPITRGPDDPTQTRGGARGSARGRGGRGVRYRPQPQPRPEHDQSPWISTTGNLDWAIW